MQRALIIASLYILVAIGNLEAQWQVQQAPINLLWSSLSFVTPDTGFVVSKDDSGVLTTLGSSRRIYCNILGRALVISSLV